MLRAVALALLAVLAGCALGFAGRLPARIVADAVDPGLEAKVRAARDLLDRGDAPGALAAIAAIGAAGADNVDLQRCRQDALRQRGRLGLLRVEAATRTAQAPGDAVAYYLQGRLLRGEAMVAAFQRSAELAPRRVWPWLGLAFAVRDSDPEDSLAIYADLYAASNDQSAVAIAYANALRAAGRLPEAIKVYEQLAGEGGAPGIGQLGLAQSRFALGSATDRQRGWSALLAAASLRPFDPGVHAVVRELLRLGLADEQVEQLLDVLRADPANWRAFARGAGVEVLVALLQRCHQPHAALQVLADAAVTARQPALRRTQRQLLLAIGDVHGFLAMLAGDLPAAVLADDANQVGARWRSLFDGPWRRADPAADPQLAVGLVAALRDVGLLDEAEMFGAAAQLRCTDAAATAALAALLDEVRRELAFEGGLRRLLYEGYAQSGAGDLDALLQHVRRLSVEALGRDVVGEVVRFQVPLVGEMLDPFAAGLCLHLARYNRHLAIGHRAGGAIEGLLVTRLSVRDLDDLPTLPVPGRCREVLGIDRSVRSLSGVLGGDLAGVALLNHYLIDYDAVTEWAGAVSARQRAAAVDGNAVLSDPLPEDLDPIEPLDVSWRLAAMSSLQDSELEAAVLETIRLHERRHLVDSFHYLPFEANVWRGLGLLLRFGLSPAAIEAEMERRAELAALALSEHPEIVLAHIAEFVGEDTASPHARGFTQLAGELVAAFVAEGAAPADAAVSRWHRLDAALVRRGAARLLGRLP